MERETRLAEKLRRVGVDLNRLSDTERERVFGLARAAWLEIWRPGLRWPSSPGTTATGGEVTRL